MAGGTAGRRTFRTVAALSLAAAASTAAACAPVTTLIEYAPSDGVRAEVGEAVTVNNLLILTEAANSPALVVGAVTNHTDGPVQVTLTFADGVSTAIAAPAAGTVLLNPANEAGETVIIDDGVAAPGATAPVTITTADSGSVTVEVPVLDGDIAPYGEYLDTYVSDAG